MNPTLPSDSTLSILVCYKVDLLTWLDDHLLTCCDGHGQSVKYLWPIGMSLDTKLNLWWIMGFLVNIFYVNRRGFGMAKPNECILIAILLLSIQFPASFPHSLSRARTRSKMKPPPHQEPPAACRNLDIEKGIERNKIIWYPNTAHNMVLFCSTTI